jgi:GNAT superfamily N-acetyltransferase
MLFATASLVRRIEHAEASLIAGFGRGAARTHPGDEVYIGAIGGGTAVAAGPLAPMSKIAGLGFEPIDEGALEHVEQEFARRNTPVRAEVASLADPEVGALLSRRGYALSGFENVLGLDLGASGPIPLIGQHAGVVAARIAPDESAVWADTVVTGFLSPDTFDAPPSGETVDRQALDDVFSNIDAVDGLVRYLARRGSEVAGGGSLRICDGVAQLCGAATLPQHRRQGVQTTLLRERLAEARRGGCDLAVVTTQPGSNSQQSTERQGFALLYVRAILIKAVRAS